MIQISFLTGQLILLGGWLLYRLAAFWKNKRIDWKNELRQIFFLIFIGKSPFFFGMAP